MLTGCIDDGYDFSNIDTTVELKAVNLTVPIEFNDIVLNEIIKVNENDTSAVIQKRLDRNGDSIYVVLKRGNFRATTPEIRTLFCNDPEEQPQTHSVTLPFAGAADTPGSVKYQISEIATSFSYEMDDIDDAVTYLNQISFTRDEAMVWRLRVDVVPTDVNRFSKVAVSGLKVQLPEGFTGWYDNGNYITDSEGVLTIPEFNLEYGRQWHGTIEVKVMEVSFDPAIDLTETHSVEINDIVKVVGGDIVGTLADPEATADPSVTFSVGYTLFGFRVEEIRGTVEYNLENPHVEDADLSGLPDILAGNGTKIMLSNPQLYLTVNNPVGHYDLGCDMGLTLTAKRDNSPEQDFILPQPIYIGHDHYNQQYKFVIAPNPEEKGEPGYEDAENIVFEDLANVLTGDGLPKKIAVTLASPAQPEIAVKGLANHFKLGSKIDDITGSYIVYTELALGQGTQIEYRTDVTGWSGPDVDAITVNELNVTAHIDNGVKVGVDLTVVPIDKAGNEIPVNEPAKVTVEASSATDITTTLRGNITGLDGIRLKAIINQPMPAEEPLRPNQTIRVSNLRATVSGNYTKKL